MLQPVGRDQLKVLFEKADDRVVPVTFVQNEGFCLIQLEGEINIASAAELKQCLLQALASGQELRLDIERATELDVTAWQLLWVSERAARGAGRGFRLAGRVPEEIAGFLDDGGFEKFPVAADPP